MKNNGFIALVLLLIVQPSVSAAEINVQTFGLNVLAPQIMVSEEEIPDAFARSQNRTKNFLEGKEGDLAALLSVAFRLADPAMRLARQIIANSSKNGLEGQIKKDTMLFEKLAGALSSAADDDRLTEAKKSDPLQAGDIVVIPHRDGKIIYIATGKTTLSGKPIFITNLQNNDVLHPTYALTREAADVSAQVLAGGISGLKRYRMTEQVVFPRLLPAQENPRSESARVEQDVKQVAQLLLDNDFPRPETLVQLRTTKEKKVTIQIDLSSLTRVQRRSAADFDLQLRHVQDLLAVTRVARIILPGDRQSLLKDPRIVIKDNVAISQPANINETIRLTIQAI